MPFLLQFELKLSVRDPNNCSSSLRASPKSSQEVSYHPIQEEKLHEDARVRPRVRYLAAFVSSVISAIALTLYGVHLVVESFAQGLRECLAFGRATNWDVLKSPQVFRWQQEWILRCGQGRA